MTEETRFFRRLSIYALIIGIVYWFVSYEWAGTTLLIVFAVGSGAVTLLLRAGVKARRRAGGDDAPATLEPDGPFGDESGRIPSATLAPFLVGVAVALAALGLVFGLWFLLVAVAPFAMGTASWLGAARSELNAVERDTGATERRTAH